MFHKLTPGCLLAIGVTTVVVMSSSVEAGWFFGRRHNVGHVTHVQRTFSAPREQLASAPAGSTLTLPGNFFGPEPGSAFLVLNNVKLPVRIDDWQETTVTLALPPMTLRHPVRAAIDVVTPQGKLALRKRLFVTPPADVISHPAAPQPPLPTNAALAPNDVIPAGN